MPHTTADVDESVSTFRKNVVALGRRSFGDSQGDQSLQYHVVQYCVKYLREENVEPLFSLEDSHAHVLASRRLPKDHLAITVEGQIAAQFLFWWANIWDCVRSNYHHSAQYPTFDELQQRTLRLGATPEMSSFTPTELEELYESYAPYRADAASSMTTQDVLVKHLLPRLIKVEHDWQMDTKWPGGRPRSHTDKHESVWWRFAREAHDKLAHAVPLTAMDAMYIHIAETLDAALTNTNELAAAYEKLLYVYNANHPEATTTCLYR